MSIAIKALQQFLKDEKLDAFLVMTKINREYLSGFTGSAGVLAVMRKSAMLFVDSRYTLRAKRESDLPVRDLKKLSTYLTEVKHKKIGVEDRITLRELAQLKKIKRGMGWTQTTNVIEKLRSEKAKTELAAIEKGSRIIDKVFERVKREIRGVKGIMGKRGVTEADIAYLIEKEGKRLGADGLAFDPIVAFGPNAASPHHFSSSARIGRNNFLLLDFGFKVKGYHSDFTRTLFIGKPNRLQVKVYETVLQAQLRAIEQVKLGNKASLVDQTARKFIAKKNFGKYFTHNTGHGVGLEIHELPSLAPTSGARRGGPNFSPASEDVLKSNFVVTVEPGIYLPGRFGVRIEDMIVVAKKPRIMSKVKKDFANMLIK
ncbi:MAG: aminopeptidase P family protein [Candidatus Doudnabacteria bacterium]|nr:aminopeptidase P family protein [Candidatus Doudnabacteria bacterium]